MPAGGQIGDAYSQAGVLCGALFMLGPLAGVGIRAVLQVDERQDHPGPGSVGAGIGEPGGELLDMAAQLSQCLIGEPESAAVQVDLPAAARPPGLVCRRDVHRGGLQHRSAERAMGGAGPTVVLLHGYPQTWYMWRKVMPALAEQYTVIAPDLRGSGGSDAPAGGYDKATLAEDIRQLLLALGRTDQVSLVGHDIGTMVSYAYAAAYPDSVRRLRLAGG